MACTLEILELEVGAEYVFEVEGRRKPLTLKVEDCSREAFNGFRQVIQLSGVNDGFYLIYRNYKGEMDVCTAKSSRHLGWVRSFRQLTA